jgi:hypothetical protein
MPTQPFFEEYPEMGVIGLALVDDPRSIVRSLKEHGVISSMVVAINYEDPLDKRT